MNSMIGQQTAALSSQNTSPWFSHRRLVIGNLTVLSKRQSSPITGGWVRQFSETTSIVTVVATVTSMLKVLAEPADIPAMLSPTLQFDVTPTQQQLLHAYQAQAASLKVTTEEFDGWLERIDELSGVDVDQLTGLHGQLIASGMLKFEISGRNVGLKYQLSQQGKKALEVKVGASDEDEDGLEDDVQFEAANVTEGAVAVEAVTEEAASDESVAVAVAEEEVSETETPSESIQEACNEPAATEDSAAEASTVEASTVEASTDLGSAVLHADESEEASSCDVPETSSHPLDQPLVSEAA